jgi:glycogen debranching enzyme
MPIVLGNRLPTEIRHQLVTRIQDHLTEWGPATEKTDSPKYTPDGYWRGPIWGPSTVLLVLGLERSGETNLAATISTRFSNLCRKSGFAENFDAITGAPLRDPAYTWTASAFLRLANKTEISSS